MFHDIKSVERLAQMAIVSHLCSMVKERIFYKTDYFAGFYFGGKLNKQNLVTILSKLPECGTGELMCHPGLDDSATIHGRNNYRRVEESIALTDNDIAEIIKLKNIEITSFKNLIKELN